MKNIILSLFTIGISTILYAQEDSTGQYINPSPSKIGIKQPEPSNGITYFLLSDKELILSYTVLLCLLIILVIEVWTIKKMQISEDNSIKLIVITLVLMGTLFIIMAGYNEKVIAPIFGLFGTIIGYMFGKTDSKK